MDERIGIIDALRSIAILGILVANLEWFCTPEVWTAQSKDADHVFERIFDSLVAFLAEGKFISALALLPGLGLATSCCSTTCWAYLSSCLCAVVRRRSSYGPWLPSRRYC